MCGSSRTREGNSAEVSLDSALRVQAAIERAYAESVPEPLHFPRPQIRFLHQLKRDLAYVPPAAGTVEIVYGEAMPAGDRVAAGEIRRIDAENLLATAEAVAEMPMQVVDRPGRYNWTSLRNLSWRVSPTGPRVLDLLGMDPDQAWSMNRTGVDSALRERGQDPFADRLAEYYLERVGLLSVGLPGHGRRSPHGPRRSRRRDNRRRSGGCPLCSMTS